VVVERAAVPRDNPPNLAGDGPNVPPVSVGPTSSEGFGNTNVLYNEAFPPPVGVQAWSGWPVGWETPTWGAPGWLASRTSTVGTCCDTIGRSCSEFPPIVARGPDPLDPQPGWTVNPEPRLYASFDEWLKGAINSLLLRGDLYVYATARQADGYPSRFVNLNPDHVQIDMIAGAIEYRLEGEPLNPADVLHVKYQTVPGFLYGAGPLDWIAQNLLSADALAKYGADLAARGGVPWGVLTHPGHVSETQATKIRNQWNTAGPLRQGAPAILSGGMTLATLSLNPEQMALLALREFDEQRIAAAFGVPPMYVGLPQPSGLNYTSSEMLADFFYRSTLRPMVKNIAGGLSGWALPRGTNVIFDASEYLQPPLPQLVAALVQAAAIVGPDGQSAVGVDDIRRALGLPIEGAPVRAPVGVT